MYLLGKWAVRNARWEIQVRRALLDGIDLPDKAVNPFMEDGPANRIMIDALTAGSTPKIALPTAKPEDPELGS